MGISHLSAGTSNSQQPDRGRRIDSRASIQPLEPKRTFRDLGCRQAFSVPCLAMGRLSCCVGDLTWEQRIQFVNSIVAKIDSEQPVRSWPVTLISLGAGGVLTEFLIDQQLRKAGYTDLRWRLIEADRRTEFADAYLDFAERLATATGRPADLKHYFSEQQYLNCPSATADQAAGLRVLLEIDPPSHADLPIAFPTAQLGQLVRVRGVRTDNLQHANAGCLIAVPARYADLIIQAESTLAGGEPIVFNGGFKFARTGSNAIGLSVCESHITAVVRAAFAAFVEPMAGIAAPSRPYGFTQMYRLLEAFVADYSSRNAEFALRLMLVTDFDVSRTRLAESFEGDNTRHLFASTDSTGFSTS
jgi:hypothetical protein